MSLNMSSNDCNSSSETPPIDFQVVQTSSPSARQNIYHDSVTGSILHILPTKSPKEIFSILLHGKLDVFRRSLDVYHNDIIQMKNEHEQTVLHVLVIYKYEHVWVRLQLMFGCDPCCQDLDGRTAAHYAVQRDDVEMLKALTARFHSQMRLFSEEKIESIHKSCLNALSIRENHGLTVFMLACQYESMNCLDYLLELNINDVHLEDYFGDTCLHYAAARRNKTLIEKLISQCQADVNGGDQNRPSVLDIVQFNREQQQAFERNLDDEIVRVLLSHRAVNRCQIKRIVKKRKLSYDTELPVTSTVESQTNPQIEQAREYARTASSCEKQGNSTDAEIYYKRAMDSISQEVLDWSDYAFNLSRIYRVHGENKLALDLLQQALIVRKRFEYETEAIKKIKHAINTIANL